MLILGVGIASSPTIMWQGGFRQAEYRIRLQSESGDFIKHATMHVTRYDGSPADKYPIVQFEAGIPVNPEDDGTFVVHQVRSGSQFGGKFTRLFGLFPIGRRGGPIYKISFRDGESEIFNVDFTSLADGFDFTTATTVNRTFTVGELIPPHLRDNPRREDYDDVAMETDFPIIERTFTVRKN